MGKVQIALIIGVALILLVVMIATWGSIGSALMGFCLLIMGAALLHRWILDRRDPEDYQMDV